MNANIVNQLNAHYPQFPNSEPEDLMIEAINDSQLLGWPEFRATFPAEMDEDDYLDQASRSFGTARFVKTWVPKMLACLQGGRN